MPNKKEHLQEKEKENVLHSSGNVLQDCFIR